MACTAQQGTADSCIASDAACADCPLFSEDGMEGFMSAVDGAFAKTQAFVMTTDPAFCDVAADGINQEITASYSCCCQTELTDYVKCNFDQELAVSFGLVGCEYGGSEDEAEGEGGDGGDGEFPLFIVIGAVAAVLLLLCCCCGCYCYRRRRNNNNVQVKVDIKSETKNETTTNEDKGSNVSKTPTAPSCDWSTGDDVELGGAIGPAGLGFSTPPGYGAGDPPHALYPNQPAMMIQPHPSQPNLGMGMVGGQDYMDDESEAYFRQKGKMKRQGSNRSLRDLDYDEVGRSRSSSRGSRKSGRKGMKRSGSKKSLRDFDSDSESSASCSSRDEVDWSTRSGKSKKRKNKKKSKRRKYPWEESMREARTMIKDSKNDMDSNAQAAMSADMINLVTDLKKQKEDMENKLKTMEDEKSILMLEMDRNQRETEKKVAHAELDVVKKEKEEMAKMIEELKKAKSEMEGKLLCAKEETERVKVEHQDTIGQVYSMINEREQLQAKLSAVEMSRDDNHMRLMKAEHLSAKLNQEKDEKKREISEWKASGNTPMMEETQRQRRTISKSLKRLEEEKAEMRSMMNRIEMVPEEPNHAVLTRPNSQMFLMDQLGMVIQRPILGRSNSSGMLMDDARCNPLVEQPLQRFERRSSLGNPASQGIVGTNPIFGSTDAMLRDLEADMMYAQAGNPALRDELAMESGFKIDRSRPAGWLGDTISNRSFTNLTELDESRSYRSHGSRRSKSSRSRSRSKHGKQSKNRDRDSSHSRLEEKREKLRKKEKSFRDEMKRSRSTRSSRKGVDCDGSVRSLDTGEIR